MTEEQSPGFRLARVLSTLGHPALLMPGAVALSTQARGAPPGVVQTAAGAAAAVALVVCLYSVWRARQGAWQHVDASQPRERLELNRLLVALLVLGALLGGALGLPAVVVAGLSACAALVLCALVLRPWMKLSLHTAFAVFAASLLWPLPAWFAGVCGLSLAVGWSRLRLRRHTRLEVCAGALAGAGVGLAFQAALHWAGKGI